MVANDVELLDCVVVTVEVEDAVVDSVVRLELVVDTIEVVVGVVGSTITRASKLSMAVVSPP